MSVPENIEILMPWRAIEAEQKARAEALSAELVAETPEGHVLHGLKVMAVAVREDRDEVLFQVHGTNLPLAVVHLTWHRETDSRWPATRLFASWDEWVRDEMLPANEEYTL